MNLVISVCILVIVAYVIGRLRGYKKGYIKRTKEYLQERLNAKGMYYELR